MAFRKIAAGFIILLIVLLLSFEGPTANAEISNHTKHTQADPGHVIVVPLDYMDWEDLSDRDNPANPVFLQLAQLGSIGLINMNTGKGHGMWNEYTSYSRGEPNQIATYSPLPLQRQLPINWSQMEQLRTKTFGFKIGELSQMIQNAGHLTSYIGTLKLNNMEFYPAGMFVIDKKGNVPFFQGGNPDTYVIRDPLAPTGQRDNVQKLIEDTAVFLHGKSGLLTVGMGDLARLEYVRTHISDSRYFEMRRQACLEIDQLLKGIVKQLSAQDTLLVVSVTPTQEQIKKQEWLGPIALIGPDIPAAGVLSSNTTRRAGVVANIDIVPTILQRLHISFGQTLGHPLVGQRLHWQPSYAEHTAMSMQKTFAIGSEQNLQFITAKLAFNTWYTQHRPFILKCFAGIAVAIVAIRLLCVLQGRPHKLWGKITKLMSSSHDVNTSNKRGMMERVMLLLCVMCCLLPTTFLVAGIIHRILFIHFGEPWISQIPVALYILFVLVAALLSSWSVLKFRNWKQRLLYLSSLMLVFDCVSLLLHDDTFAQSLLGYDPVNGARYYGIGNEYMAGFVAAWLLFWAALIAILGMRILPLGWVASGVFVAFLASPVYGANIGGAITAGLGSTFLLYRLSHTGSGSSQERGRKALYRDGWFVMGGASLITMLIIYLMQMRMNQFIPPSHAGEMLQLVKQGEWSLISFVIHQKMQMNLDMLFVSPFWLGVGSVVVGTIAYIFIQHPIFKKWKQEQQWFYHVLVCGVLSACIGYMFNDSGIIVSLLLVYPILFVLLAWINKEGEAA